MEEVVEASNMKAALKRVRENKGSPGIDGMTVKELRDHLIRHWRDLRAQLLAGTYQPSPVRRQPIPKAGGGIRELGIPTVVDRLIQQAILQVLQVRFDPTFSEHSYGFRPGRSAHQAVCAAQKYIQGGRSWVVDLDLEKFFDRVNHDVLMGRLAKRIEDKRLLGIIRRYLEAGVMTEGVVIERDEGTPQGGPLSPLLGNVLLDEVDKDLERRGHAFVRYADDLNVYVGSERAGRRVFEMLQRLLAKLHLRVNETKSAVARPWGRHILGFAFRKFRDGTVKRGLSGKSLSRFKQRIRELTSGQGGRRMKAMLAELRDYLRGWKQYFQLMETRSGLRGLDEWLRRRVRMVQLRQWKRGPTIYRKLRSRGVDDRTAREVGAHASRPWAIATHPGMNRAMPNSTFDKAGIPRLAT